MESVVVALGGNAILRAKDTGTDEEQFANVRRTCSHIVRLISEGYRVTITHGGGPQIGNIVIRNEVAVENVPSMPLDICTAESLGMIGYIVQNSLANALRATRVEKTVLSVITQAIVDRADPAFRHPSKPIGPFFTREEAMKLRRQMGLTMMEDAGRGYRRAVPSPDPKAIVEIEAVRKLIQSDVVTICSPYLPVVERGGQLERVQAVLDKDLASERLASGIGADVLLILTDVEKVAVNYGKSNQKDLDHITVAEAEEFLRQGHFAPGSMQPKVKAAARFVKAGGKRASISSLDRAYDSMKGNAGTTIS